MNTNLSKEQIEMLCSYAANNFLAIQQGEKIIDAKADPQAFSKTLLNLNLDIATTDIKITKSKLNLIANPSDIVEVCNTFDAVASSKNPEYETSLSARIIKAIRATAYMSLVTTIKTLNQLKDARMVAYRSEPLQLGLAFN